MPQRGISAEFLWSSKVQVQHDTGPLITMQKSVFLPLWDNYELNGHKILRIESFSAIGSEKVVRISKFFI